jgi:hypothetical protein
LAAALVLSLASFGCSSDSGSGSNADAAPKKCDIDHRAPRYTAGANGTGKQGVVVKIMDSNPAPPHPGDNEWTIDVEYPEGTPVSGAQITLIQYMPDHKHSALKTPVFTDMGNGSYDVKPVNFRMEGYWQNTFKVTLDPKGNAGADGGAAVSDSVEIDLCVD